MPIEFHDDCKHRLFEVLRTALPTVKAKNGMFIERKSAMGIAVCDMTLPQTGKLHERLIEYVDEFPFVEFVLDVLADELWKLDKYDSEREAVKLCEIEGYSDPGAIATRLIDSFQTLPWTYQLSFRLPDQLKGLLRPTVDEVALSPSLKIVRATKQFSSQFPLAAPNKKQQERMKGSVGLLSLLMSDPPTYDPENSLSTSQRGRLHRVLWRLFAEGKSGANRPRILWPGYSASSVQVYAQTSKRGEILFLRAQMR